MNNKFCILIPTINQKSLLIKSLYFYDQLYPNTMIYVLDNGKQGIKVTCKNVAVIESDYNLGVSASWNFLIDNVLNEYDSFLVLNDDVTIKCPENELIEMSGQEKFYVCEPKYNWSSFFISKKIYTSVGKFDENFKGCFFEDNDYHRRMVLSNLEIINLSKLNPFVYNNSMSTKTDQRLNKFLDNKNLYIRKWGGMPNFETFKTPYNE